MCTATKHSSRLCNAPPRPTRPPVELVRERAKLARAVALHPPLHQRILAQPRRQACSLGAARLALAGGAGGGVDAGEQALKRHAAQRAGQRRVGEQVGLEVVLLLLLLLLVSVVVVVLLLLLKGGSQLRLLLLVLLLGGRERRRGGVAGRWRLVPGRILLVPQRSLFVLQPPCQRRVAVLLLGRVARAERGRRALRWRRRPHPPRARCRLLVLL